MSSGYPNFLKYFMWKWQVHFGISFQTSAESLFDRLDRSLEPNVFIIGFSKNVSNAEIICYEPEKIDFLTTHFTNLSGFAKEILDTHDDRYMMYSGPGMQEQMDEKLNDECYRLAIESILNKVERYNGKLHFVAQKVHVFGFDIFLILQLNKDVYDSHNYLTKKTNDDRARINRSLIEVVISLFLNEYRKILYLPNPGYGRISEARTSEEILREAAKQFMYTISSKGKNYFGIHRLFEACNNISISKYEGIECFGQIIVAEKSNPDIKMSFELKEPFSIHNYRKTRKLLEHSSSKIGVVTDSNLIFGLGYISDSYKPSSESIFSVHFKGLHSWDLNHGNIILMQLRYGNPKFSHESLDRKTFFSLAKRIFGSIIDGKIEKLYHLSKAITTQKKGAMLVISMDAEKESSRLSSRSIGINPLDMNNELILNLTNIDGAVLIDLSGYAYANGVILDGIVNSNGDSSRGSRYNSAITYYENQKHLIPTMIVVVSEDGMVDIIPQLLPQIKRSEITVMIKLLEQLNSEEKFDRVAFYNTMDWLEKRRFYLTSDDCIKINLLKRELHEWDKKGNYTMWVTHDDLVANPEMDDSFYISE